MCPRNLSFYLIRGSCLTFAKHCFSWRSIFSEPLEYKSRLCTFRLICGWLLLFAVLWLCLQALSCSVLAISCHRSHELYRLLQNPNVANWGKWPLKILCYNPANLVITQPIFSKRQPFSFLIWIWLSSLRLKWQSKSITNKPLSSSFMRYYDGSSN